MTRSATATKELQDFESSFSFSLSAIHCLCSFLFVRNHDSNSVSPFMEDKNPNSSEERSPWRKEPCPDMMRSFIQKSGHEATAVYFPDKDVCKANIVYSSDRDVCKATAIYSSDKDHILPDITWLRPSTVTKEKDEVESSVVSNQETIAPNDGTRVQAVVNTHQKQESCIVYAQNFQHNLIAQQSTGDQEECHVLDLSVHSRQATAIQRSQVSSERMVCDKESQDGSRKRERILTQEKPCKKKICQNSSKERNDTEILLYICPECGICFNSLLRFTDHQRSHTRGLIERQEINAWGKPDTSAEDQTYICPECGKSFISFPSFVEHQKSHTEDVGSHQRTTHAQNELYVCTECGECFYSFSLFTEHKKSHTRGKTDTTGKGHNLLPWMLPGSPRMLHGLHANYEPMLGNTYPSPSPLIWVPYSPLQTNYSLTQFMPRFPVPHLQSYEQTPPLPTQMPSLYTQASDLSAPGILKQGGAFTQWQVGSVSSGSQEEEATTSAGGSFMGRKDTKVLKNQAGKSHQLNPQPKLNLFQRNHAGQSLFPCLDCGELKVNPSQLTLHRQDCKREGLVRCSLCKKRFPNEQIFHEHKKSHASEDT